MTIPNLLFKYNKFFLQIQVFPGPFYNVKLHMGCAI